VSGIVNFFVEKLVAFNPNIFLLMTIELIERYLAATCKAADAEIFVASSSEGVRITP